MEGRATGALGSETRGYYKSGNGRVVVAPPQMFELILANTLLANTLLGARI